jgi:DNA-binding response OmpR family regulator
MKDTQTILVVDDEPKILELVKSYLKINGYGVLCAKNGGEGMALFERNLDSENPVSLILLDLMLPDFSGEELCKKVRQSSDVPIIMITAKAEEENIIRGLSIGADDYVTKPFSPRQLVARVAAALRRSGGNKAAAFLSCGALTIDTEKRIVKANGEILNLTRDEYRILSLLMSRPAKIFTREEILEEVKGEGYDGFDRSIDTHIKKLRAKIEDDSKTPKYIITVYGMGYRMNVPANAQTGGAQGSAQAGAQDSTRTGGPQ